MKKENNKTSDTCVFRREEDFLGERTLSQSALYGIHTVRAIENFPLSGRNVHAALIAAFGDVKRAAARTSRGLGFWADDPAKADAIEKACAEMAEGRLDKQIVVDALQGGAGTSTNMNVNEVLANRALELCGDRPGHYERISPLDDVNLHQSTNDAYPTALKLAVLRRLDVLEANLGALILSFQKKEKEFASILKIGRTQLQDAVPTTLGREMAAYASALGRDRIRLAKGSEPLLTVNLGGTAIGTGITAPREYILRATQMLRDITGLNFVRAEDMVDNTQNADVFVEVSGLLKAHAATLIKIATDLRLLSSGPEGGLGEINLPARQAGSSIMPGKVNPVIPEAVTQAAMRMIGHDAQITMAAAAGNLELNAFLPLIADCLLDGIDLLANAAVILREKCVEGLTANEDKCRQRVEGSTALVTALVSSIGYARASAVSKKAKQQGKTVRQIVLEEGLMTEESFNRLVSPEAVLRLGASTDSP